MWNNSENSEKSCDLDCHCSRLIPETFKINSGNESTKRRRESSIKSNFPIKMKPQYLDFSSPTTKSPRNVLGTIQNYNISPVSIQHTPKSIQHTPKSIQHTPKSLSYSTTPSKNISGSKILRVFQDRKMFSNLDKENHSPNMFLADEETLMSFDSPKAERFKRKKWIKTLSADVCPQSSENLETPRKLDLDSASRDSGFEPSAKKFYSEESTSDFDAQSTSKLHFYEDSMMSDLDVTLTGECQKNLVPDKDLDDVESLQDLEAEFDSDIFDKCTDYEIVSTDSPDIITRGSSRKIKCTNFNFGAPLSDAEPSTSFNSRSHHATRMLNFDFAPPAEVKNVKKSLFNTPTRLQRDSSLESISESSKTFTRNNSASSGFMSEIEESFIFDNLSENDCGSPTMTGLGDLISGDIKLGTKTDVPVRKPAFARSLSLNPDVYMSPTEKLRIKLGKSNIESPKRPFKRPEPPAVLDVEAAKRRKNEECHSPVLARNSFRPVLQRAFSESHASIMMALNRSASEPDLIGDFSRNFVLPLTAGKHSDLKSISSETLADLLGGKYDGSISEYKVIDCRYPYEYEGGHIRGATNLYSKDQISTFLQEHANAIADPTSRKILIFHCEFSLERGPTLFRFLRSSDRAMNKERYPSLNYPEIYLLHDGYKAFYSKFSELCEPRAYRPMLDSSYTDQLRHFRNEGSKLRKCFSVEEGRKSSLQRQKSKSRLLL